MARVSSESVVEAVMAPGEGVWVVVAGDRTEAGEEVEEVEKVPVDLDLVVAVEDLVVDKEVVDLVVEVVAKVDQELRVQEQLILVVAEVEIDHQLVVMVLLVVEDQV